jgi:hypothetical protein
MQHSVHLLVPCAHPDGYRWQPGDKEWHQEHVFVLPVVRSEMKCVAQAFASVIVSAPESESRVEQRVSDAFVNVVK